MDIRKRFASLLMLLLLVLSTLFSMAARLPQSDFNETIGFGIPRDSAWSADGTHFLVVTTSAAQLYAWDGETLMLEDTIESPRALRSGVLSNNGNTIFLGTEAGWIEEWDPASGEKTREWQAHSLVVLDLILNEDSTRLISIGWRSHPVLWNPESASPLAILETSSLGAQAAAFLPDGKIAVWSKWLQLQLFSPDGSLYAQRSTQQFSTPPTFSNDGSLLAGRYAGRVQIIDVLSGKLLHEISTDFEFSGFTFADDNHTLLISGEGQAVQIDALSGLTLESIQLEATQQGSRVHLAPNTTHLLWITDQIYLRNLRPFSVLSTFAVNARADDFIVSSDASLLASRVEKLPYVELWRSGESQPVQTIEQFTLPVQDFRFLPDNTLVTSADSIQFWNPLTGEALNEWTLPRSNAEEDLLVWVYDADEKETVRVALDTLPTGKIATNPDGTLLAVEGLDGTVTVFSTQTNEQIALFKLAVEPNVTKLQSNIDALVFDGNTRLGVFLSNGTLQTFDLSSGETINTLPLSTPLSDLPVCSIQYPADEHFPTYATEEGQFIYEPEQRRFVNEPASEFCGAPQLQSAALIANKKIAIPDAGLTFVVDDLQVYQNSYTPPIDQLILQQGRYAEFNVQVRSLPESLPEDWVQPVPLTDYQNAPLAASQYDFASGQARLITHLSDSEAQSAITAVAVNPENSAELISFADGSLLFYANENADPQTLITATPHRAVPSRAVAFNPSGELKAAGDDAGMLRLWDKNNHLTEVDTSGGAVQQLLFSPDGNFLAVRGSELISFWQITINADGLELEQFSKTMTGTLMAFSPEGTRFAVAAQADFHHPVTVWDFPDFANGKQFDLPVTELVFSNEDRFYAISNGLWVCNLGNNCRTIETPETFTTGDLSIAPDESKAVLITIDGRVVKVDLTTD